jgi:hypothetical protein
LDFLFLDGDEEKTLEYIEDKRKVNELKALEDKRKVNEEQLSKWKEERKKWQEDDK